MRSKIFVVLIIALLLTGCSSRNNPEIMEYGETDWTFDDTYVIVTKAKPGLVGYETVETDDGIDVIFHYDKK